MGCQKRRVAPVEEKKVDIAAIPGNDAMKAFLGGAVPAPDSTPLPKLSEDILQRIREGGRKGGLRTAKRGSEYFRNIAKLSRRNKKHDS